VSDAPYLRKWTGAPEAAQRDSGGGPDQQEMSFVGLAGEQEAYAELEKYISGDSASTVKTLMSNIINGGIQAVECVRGEPTRRYSFGGASLWACSSWVGSLAT